MREWNENFSQKRKVEGETITVGQQNFENSTIEIMTENGSIIDCPMGMNNKGDIYFIYKNTGVYVSEYLGEFPILIKESED